LTNCSFKIFSKCATNRLCGISDALISQNQTTFLKGRYILESVVAAHEIIHDVAYSDQSILCLNWIMIMIRLIEIF
jgi:hypothetical protein